MSRLVTGICSGVLLTLGLNVLNNSDIKKQVGQIKENVSNTDISCKNFKQLENKIGNVKLLDNPSNSSKTAIKWQEALDSIRLEGAAKKAYHQGVQAVKASATKASRTVKF